MAAIVAALVLVPSWVVSDGNLDASDRARLASQGAVRATILQLVAGVIVVLGLVYTAVQVGISRETHYTDRYTKAIDQLGHGKTIVRVGGIFALKRLALNSVVDKPTVRYVLSSYLKAGAFLPPGPKPAAATKHAQMEPDVQAALTVLIELRDHAD